MKKLFLAALLYATVFTIFSCQKADLKPNNISPDQPAVVNAKPQQYASAVKSDEPVVVRDRVDNCLPTEVMLVAGQTMDAGTVTVSNDPDYIYVTYTTANGWLLTQTHLYVGDCALIPVNNPGNPIPGQFPYGGNHDRITSYTYQVPISAIPVGGCGCIAAHAVVVQVDGSGHVTNTQTAWGNGVRINLTGGNWGMKFDYCSCTPEP